MNFWGYLENEYQIFKLKRSIEWVEKQSKLYEDDIIVKAKFFRENGKTYELTIDTRKNDFFKLQNKLNTMFHITRTEERIQVVEIRYTQRGDEVVIKAEKDIAGIYNF